MQNCIPRLGFCLLFLILCTALSAQAHTTLDLKVAHQTEPYGVDDAAPRLSWRMAGDAAGLFQSAYQILVATSAEKLVPGEADLWDSGQVASTFSHSAYAGNPLPSSAWLYWSVRTWSDEAASAWAEPHRFLTALIGAQPQQPYIAFRDETPFHDQRRELHLPPTRYYRTTFTPERKIVRAIAHASALGIYELHVNGQRVGDAYFAPGWTDYRQRAYYGSYDLTAYLTEQANAIGAIVADGWYAGYLGYGKLAGYGPHRSGRNIYGKTPALMVEIHVFYDDGSQAVIGTDTRWKTTTGPESEADFLMGEAYDARMEMPGWATSNFDDSAWQAAILAKDNGSIIQNYYDDLTRNEAREFGFIRPPVLQAYPAQPVRITEEVPAQSVNEIKPGVWIFDLGQNIAGNVRLKVNAAAGQKLVLRFGEMLYPDGRLMTANLRRARATDTYIAKGADGYETWAPRFTTHGFQFVELSGFEGQPPLDTITGLVMHSDTPFTSGFECSDPVVNQIYQNTVWTQRGNWIELPTDCPQRDERLGWTGDVQIYIAAAAIHADVAAFFRKWLRELEEAITPEGYYPSYAPYPFGHHGFVHASAWSCAGVIVPYALWQATGDRAFFTEHWPAMTRFMEARKAHDPALEGKAFGVPWGDWLNVDDPTPSAFVELAYFAKTARMMMEMAREQGFSAQAAQYAEWLETLRANFRQNHLDAAGAIYFPAEARSGGWLGSLWARFSENPPQPGSQTAYVLALDCGLLTDPAERKLAGGHLAALIQKRAGANNSGMTTGFLGTKALLPVLAETGHFDLAVATLQSRQLPSWGYSVENGATTIWERWDGYTHEYGFDGAGETKNTSLNSFSHYAFGAVTEWMFTTLAGIAPAEPGYAKIRLHPHFPAAESSNGPDPISWVRAHHDSPHGRIAVYWQRREDGSLLYEATVPVNTTAELILPEASPWLQPQAATTTHTLLPGFHRFVVTAADEGD